MSKVLIIGCGGVASVAIHKCCQVPEVFTEICIASRTKAKCDKLAAELAPTTATKITTAQVDADKVEEVIALIKAYQPDLVMNIALPYQDLTIMDACLACGVNYMDTANYEPENTDDPEWRAIYEKRCKEAGFSAYFDYSWQWAYAKKFEEAGLTALLGSGFDPGVTQAYCAYAKKHEFDTIDTIDILDCNGGDHGYAFATNFNPEINLREVSAPGSYWENGHWVEIPAMSIKREYNFDQVGDKGIHTDKVDIKAVGIARAEYRADLFLLVLTQQTVIHEHAGQLLADGLSQHSCQNGGIHATGQGAQHLAIADALTQGLDVVLHKGVHLPVTGAAADVVHEVAQHLLAFRSVQHFRMELDRVQALLSVLCRSYRAVDRVSSDLKAGRSLLNIVVVAHPADGGGLHISEQLALSVHEHFGLAVLALRCAADMAAQQVHHQLAAVADAQHRHTPVEDLRVDRGGIFQINAVGATGKDDTLGVLCLDNRQIGFIGIDFTVDIVLADAARDQLIVLAAKVQHDDSFMLHEVLSSLIHSMCFYR